MSSDTAQLLREHVNAVKELIAGEKPDRKKKENVEQDSADAERQ